MTFSVDDLREAGLRISQALDERVTNLENAKEWFRLAFEQTSQRLDTLEGALVAQAMTGDEKESAPVDETWLRHQCLSLAVSIKDAPDPLGLARQFEAYLRGEEA